MRFFKYCWNLCYITGKKIVIALFHLIFITIFCTLPHELGHALAINFLGCKVKHIIIGFLRSSEYGFSFKFFKYEVKLEKIPLIFGFTHYGDNYKNIGGRGKIFVASAGLLVNLLLALLAGWAESKVKNKFGKKFFRMVKEYNILTIIYNFLVALGSPNCDVRKIFSLLFRKK